MPYGHDSATFVKAEKYLELARSMGAADAVAFEASQICWDSRNVAQARPAFHTWASTCSRPSSVRSAPLHAGEPGRPGPELVQRRVY